MSPMCIDMPLAKGYVCPGCGGTNVRMVNPTLFQCCSDPYDPKKRSCGYLDDEQNFLLEKNMLLEGQQKLGGA